MRIWPLSARPWAFIHEHSYGEAAALVFEVDCKISEDEVSTELGPRLVPKAKNSEKSHFSVLGFRV